jgi:multidrug resistance efflux pump
MENTPLPTASERKPRRPRPTPPPESPRRWRVLAWSFGAGMLLLAVSASVALLTIHSHSRADGLATATVSKPPRSWVAVAFVDVPYGVTPLFPTQQGRVSAVFAKEGMEVNKGEPLMEIDPTLARMTLAEAEISLDSAKTRLKQAQRLFEQHESQVEAQKAAIDRARWKKAGAEDQAKKAERFFKNKIGGVQKEDVEAAKKLVEEAEAGIRAEEAKLKAIESLKPDMAVELAQLDVKSKVQQLEKAKFALKECTVFAPEKGMVLRRQVNVGEVLGANPQHAPLLFCPVGERFVRAEVEQEFASRVSLGQKARIEDDSTGGGDWQGTVHYISDWYSRRRSTQLEPLQFNDVRTMEVIIRVDKSKNPLRIGQRVRVTLDGMN